MHQNFINNCVMKKNFVCSVMLSSLFAFTGCASIPDGATAVKPFDLSKYMGNWYEIARIDFRHERGLDNTSAHYSINPDGTIKVVNRGRNMETGLYQESVGKAKVVSLDGSAMLKVSFFGPFYSGYNVLAIDDEYKYALVAGSNYKYLWMLSREKSMPNYIQDKYMEVAEKAGFDTYKLIWINQD